jgi:hypothetical protein
MEALRMPVVIKLQIGQPLDHGAREGGPLAHRANDAEALQSRNDRVGRTERLIENLNIDVVGDFRPIGHRERDILVIVKDCAAKRHQLLVAGGVTKDPAAMIGPETEKPETISAVGADAVWLAIVVRARSSGPVTTSA